MGPKRRIITNWALLRRVFPNYISFTMSRHSSMLINKNCAIYVNELSIDPCLCYIQEDVSVLCTVTGLPFDQMEPSRSVQHTVGRKTWCVLQNWNGIFPASELSFTRGFMNELMTDWWQIIKTIFCLFRVYFGLLFKLTLNHQGPYNGKMNRY